MEEKEKTKNPITRDDAGNVKIELAGEMVSFDDYRRFQKSQASATDLDSLVMLERGIAVGERRKGTDPIVWAIAAVIFFIGIAVAWYIIGDLGLLEGLTGGGGGGEEGEGTIEIMMGMARMEVM
jgi:hypothetical protein